MFSRSERLASSGGVVRTGRGQTQDTESVHVVPLPGSLHALHADLRVPLAAALLPAVVTVEPLPRAGRPQLWPGVWTAGSLCCGEVLLAGPLGTARRAAAGDLIRRMYELSDWSAHLSVLYTDLTSRAGQATLLGTTQALRREERSEK